MSSDEEDLVTPTASPVTVKIGTSRQKITYSNECDKCRLSNKRHPITCETDLYQRKVSPCKHDKAEAQTLTRSSSFLTFEPRHEGNGKHFDQQSHQPPPPPRLTNTLTNKRKEVIRPIACKPAVSGNRFYEGPMNQQMERHGSEISLGRLNTGIDTRRFGGSLCNVLTSTRLNLRREISESVPYMNTTLATGKSAHPNISQQMLKVPETQQLQKTPQYYQHVQGMQATTSQDLAMTVQPHQTRVTKHSIGNDSKNIESAQVQTLVNQLVDVRTELDEVNWLLYHRSSEVDILKAKLKESQLQGDQNARESEAMQFRTVVKELNLEINTLRAQLSQAVLSVRRLERENALLMQKVPQNDSRPGNESEENVLLRKRLIELELRYSLEYTKWDRQRKKWTEEQKRVLRYQKALQHNYLLTCQKAQTLAAQVESFSSVSI